MTDEQKPLGDFWALDRLVESLQERAKELNCLYQIEEILRRPDEPLSEICTKIVNAIPSGLQYSDLCQVKLVLDGIPFMTSEFVETEWVQSADIIAQDRTIGRLSVYYTREMPILDHGPFLRDEVKLIQTIAERIGLRIMHQQMRQLVKEWESARDDRTSGERGEWRVVLKMLRQTDLNLFQNISRKMLNYMCWSGVAEAEQLLKAIGEYRDPNEEEDPEDWNRPHQRRTPTLSVDYSEEAFDIAGRHLNDEEILRLIQKWLYEDKLSFLVQVVNRNLTLPEVADAIRRHHQFSQDEPEVASPQKRGIEVSLIRRFFSDQLNYINIAKNYMDMNDFYHLLQKIIYTAESHGKLGGKSAGLYLAAHILQKKAKDLELLQNVKTPKTWHITSDILLHFMHYNNFDEVVEQKYKEINQVRLEYPHIVQAFKSARFPPDIIKGLSVALDDFGDKPLIVRSSSLLEDRAGAAFSGKYKSLFLANRGGKQQRLEALMDAIAEVYASTFSADPIEYRAERGLLDFGEEMGIIIQEVVGSRVGRYFLPTYAGVAFSNNEFSWSPRIKRKDGLIRLVPGLGTRAVDRLSDDYPVLVAPGQPRLKVNITPDEVARYSPKKIDVINLETNSFESMEIGRFLREVGYDLPGVNQVVSIWEDDHIRRPMGLNIDFEHDSLVANFGGLIDHTSFVKQMHLILTTLEQTLGMPVDIEFASDGRDFYLLQCRPQSYSEQSKPAPIPKDIPADQVIFTARRYVSNGRVPDISHIVYVDPERYAGLDSREELLAVGHAVGYLNTVLPKRQFILMGPGRWGSRGDIKLGVSVTYADINNTAVLVEIARKKGNYLPDLSFGTHFFQDLVEANIRYLPLYPDDGNVVFNDRFLTQSPNILSQVAPEFAAVAETVRLIDVPQVAGGMVLRILMNAEMEQAVGYLAPPQAEIEVPPVTIEMPGQRKDEYWRWRFSVVERIASELDGERFGVAGLYVFGSTKNATAGPGSDIDLIVHFQGTPAQQTQLLHWLEGWSLCLAEMNYIRTGYRSGGLLDVHIVTDDDIANRTGFAAKIGAVTDAARPLTMKRRSE